MTQTEKLGIYQDNIWGDVDLDDLAKDIIDTPEFQRLDQIRQLSFSYFVYRGAKHTRFEHSIGVYHITKRIFNEILDNHNRLGIDFPKEDISESFGKHDYEKIKVIKKIVSIAGLLHDITHIPFGHSLEDEFSVYIKHDAVDSLRLWYLLFDKKSEIRNKIVEKKKIYGKDISNKKLFKLIYVILKFKLIITSERSKSFEKEIIEKLKDILKEENSEEKIKLILDSFENKLLNKNELIDDIPDIDYLKEDGNLKKLIKSHDKFEKIAQLAILYAWYFYFKKNKMFHPFMADVFANTICADLLDYLKRDGQQSGLSELRYSPRIFKHFYIGKDESNNELRLAIGILDKRGMERTDIINIIINLMGMRHRLAETVYYHKTKTIVTSMFLYTLNVLDKYNVLPQDSNPYSDENSILKFGDEELMIYLGNKLDDLREKESPRKEYSGKLEYFQGQENEIEVALNILKSIRERKLYKVGAILTRPLFINTNLGSYITDLIEKYHFDPNHKQKIRELENYIENEVGCKNKILIYCPPHHPQAKEVATFIQIKKEGDCLPINQFSNKVGGSLKKDIELISKEKYENLWKFFLFVPPVINENEVLITKIVQKFIKKILEDHNSIDKLEEITNSRDLIASMNYIKGNLVDKLFSEWLEDYKGLVPPDIEELMREKKLQNFREDTSLTSKEAYFVKFGEFWDEIVEENFKDKKPEIVEFLKINTFKDDLKAAVKGFSRAGHSLPSAEFVNAIDVVINRYKSKS